MTCRTPSASSALHVDKRTWPVERDVAADNRTGSEANADDRAAVARRDLDSRA
jgi:hypothetical protein